MSSGHDLVPHDKAPRDVYTHMTWDPRELPHLGTAPQDLTLASRLVREHHAPQSWLLHTTSQCPKPSTLPPRPQHVPSRGWEEGGPSVGASTLVGQGERVQNIRTAPAWKQFCDLHSSVTAYRYPGHGYLGCCKAAATRFQSTREVGMWGEGRGYGACLPMPGNHSRVVQVLSCLREPRDPAAPAMRYARVTPTCCP